MMTRINSYSNLGKLQKEVDDWTGQYTPQYWPVFEQLAHLMEENGELAREILHVYGVKKKNPEEAAKRIGGELGDILFTLVCIANTCEVDLQKEWDELMSKRRYGRDSERFDKNDS